MNISLPEQMRTWVENVVSGDGFGTASEYIRSLIRQDQKRRSQNDLDAKLLHALDAGAETELTPEVWNGIRETVREELNRAKPKQ
jgi:antitoxin ParD1/3/4